MLNLEDFRPPKYINKILISLALHGKASFWEPVTCNYFCHYLGKDTISRVGN